MTDTVLDQPDPAFPAGAGSGIPEIRALYRGAKRAAWDPSTAVPWDSFDASAYDKETLFAARVYWSGRAWGEYGAIAESPALQLRYDLDGLEPELSLFWALRTQEEARHAEVSSHMADLLGGYFDGLPPELVPPSPAGASTLEASNVPHLGTRARALAPGMPVEATIAGLVCVAETMVLDVFRELIGQLRDPVAREIFRLIARDETRHCQFGWLYLAHRADAMTDEIRAACAAAMTSMVADIELGGYRSPWLDPPRNPALVELEAKVFAAGLGGTTAEWEGPIIVDSIRNLRRRASRLGIELPLFHHAALGEI